MRLSVVLFLLLAPAALANPPTLEALLSKPTISNAKISPDGKHIAIRLNQGDSHTLRFVTREGVATGGISVKDDSAGRSEVGNFWWVNNERVLGQIFQYNRGDESPKFYGELFATNYDNSEREFLFGVRSGKGKDNAWGDLVDTYPLDDRKVLISKKRHNRKADRLPVAKLMDVYSGREYEVLAEADYPFASFFCDTDGNIRVVVSEDSDDVRHVKLRPEPGSDWQTLPQDSFGENFLPITYATESDSFFAMDNLNRDKTGLYRYALESHELEHVYTHDVVDVASVVRTTDSSSVYALRLFDGYPRYVLLGSEAPERDLFRDLLGTFSGDLIEITSRSDDGRFWIILAHSDRDPGSFFLFDREKNSLVLLFQMKPELQRESLAPMEPVVYESFDGRQIHGYLTKGLPHKGDPPLLVYVHGGPRARDYWGFDPIVQALATHGISVLQVNFRGSTGYGEEHRDAGNRQWGDAVQKDIIAGAKWAIGEGHVREDQVCIGGTSFGGYSAVMSATLEPDLFECIIANAGIYDLQLLYETGDVHQFYGGEKFLNRAIGNNEEELTRYSPVHHVGRLQAPVLLVHGRKDQRAPFKHAKLLKKALDKHDKPVETVFESTEGHGFYDTENQIDFVRKMIVFIRQST